MVLEVAMISVLTGMGVYFVKSTDLPKELQERSEILKRENSSNNSFKPKFNFNAKVANLEVKKNQLSIELINQKIDKLTLEITTLEQEIKANNERNIEIQAAIDLKIAELELLTKSKIS